MCGPSGFRGRRHKEGHLPSGIAAPSSTSIAARPSLVMRSANGPRSSSRCQIGSEPLARTSSSRPARMSFWTTFRAASPRTFVGSSTPRSSRCEAAHKMMSCVSVSFDIGTLLRLLRHRLPHHHSPTLAMQPAGQNPEALLAPGMDHTTALFAFECKSFLGNVIDEFRTPYSTYAGVPDRRP